MSRKVKSVSFNLSDPMELEMYEHTKKYSSFSTFVKRLIQNSLNGGIVKIENKNPSIPNNSMSNPVVNKDLLRQLIWVYFNISILDYPNLTQSVPTIRIFNYPLSLPVDLKPWVIT